ncbi:MAG: hypothetical protein KDC54_02825 [Lewinella sp.]|nr:hypothetical protein [Lewinella sp.]
MKTFIRSIERQVGINRLEAAIDELLDTLNHFDSNNPEARQEVSDLRKYFISLSQRLYEANDNRKRGTISDAEVSQERRNVGANVIEMVNDFHRYPHFSAYLKTKEDEDAWQRASNLNTIDAYQEYFNEFPDGKYKEQTHELILELRDVERRRAEEIKRIAEEEKQRRREGYQNTQAPPPPPPRPEPARTQQGFYQGGAQQQPRSAFQQPSASGDGQQTIQPMWFIGAGILSIWIPLVGLGLGLYTRFAKKDGVLTYDEQTRKYGNYVLIVGAIFFLYYFITLSIGGGGYMY